MIHKCQLQMCLPFFTLFWKQLTHLIFNNITAWCFWFPPETKRQEKSEHTYLLNWSTYLICFPFFQFVVVCVFEAAITVNVLASYKYEVYLPNIYNLLQRTQTEIWHHAFFSNIKHYWNKAYTILENLRSTVSKW